MMKYREQDARTTLGQIGGGNVLAISGGRWSLQPAEWASEAAALVLPVSSGYRVEIRLTVMDTYEVRRVFVRAGKRFEKGREEAYADNIGDTAYRASCYKNVPFGD